MANIIDAIGTLVDGSMYDVDDAPRFPLGRTVTTDDGKTFVYVKATAALAAGTAYKVAPITISTASATAKGKISITATTPTILTTVTPADIAGALVKVTDTNSNVLGVFGIKNAALGASSNIVADCDGVGASTDTLAGIADNTPAVCGGSPASGKTQGTPLTAIASGKYGWVMLQNPIAASA